MWNRKKGYLTFGIVGYKLGRHLAVSGAILSKSSKTYTTVTSEIQLKMKIATAGHWILYSNCSVSKRHSTVSCLLIVQKQCCFVPPVNHRFQTASRPVFSAEVVSSTSRRVCVMPQGSPPASRCNSDSSLSSQFWHSPFVSCIISRAVSRVLREAVSPLWKAVWSEVWFVVRFWLDF